MKLSEYIGKFPGKARARFRKQLAEDLGVSVEAIRYWELGSRKPRIKYVLKIEEMTGGKVNRFELRPDVYKRRNAEVNNS